MTEDTRKWANANARTTVRLASAITDFNVAQEWEKEAQVQEQEPGPGVSKAEFFDDLKKVSRRRA